MPNETAESKILNRLKTAPSIFPASTRLFTDWTIEPGDVVTVRSDNSDYSVPVYSMELNWTGQSMVDIASTGNQKREPLPALQRKQYGSGAAMRRAIEELEETTAQQYQHWTEENDQYRTSVYRIMGVSLDQDGNVVYQVDPQTGEYIVDGSGNKIPVFDPTSGWSLSGQVTETAQGYERLYTLTGVAYEEFDPTHAYHAGDLVQRDGITYEFTVDHTGAWSSDHVRRVTTLQSRVTQTATDYQSLYTATGVNNLGQDETLYSRITQEVGRIDQVLGRTTTQSGGVVYTIESRLSQAESNIGLFVTSTTSQGQTTYKINAGAIALAINNDETVDALISANRIKMNADNITFGSKARVTNGTFYLDGTVMIGGSYSQSGGYVNYASINNNGITALTHTVRQNGSLVFVGASDGEHYDLTTSNVPFIVTGFGAVTSNAQTGQISIPYKTVYRSTAGGTGSDGNPQTINFNIADMAFYQNHIGINTATLYASSDEASDWSDWTKNAYGTLNVPYGLVKVTPNGGSDYYFGVNATGVYTAGQNSVAPTSATISSSTLNASTGRRTASLYVRYAGTGQAERGPTTVSGVDVTNIYNEGLNSGTEVNSYPVTFKVTFTDDGTPQHSHVGNVTVDCADIYNQGARDAVTRLYVWASNGGAVRVYTMASSNTQYQIGMLTVNTEVEVLETSGNWIKISLRGIPGTPEDAPDWAAYNQYGWMQSQYLKDKSFVNGSDSYPWNSNYNYTGWRGQNVTDTVIKGIYSPGYSGAGQVSILYASGETETFQVYASESQVTALAYDEGTVRSTASKAYAYIRSSGYVNLIGRTCYAVYSDGTVSPAMVILDPDEEEPVVTVTSRTISIVSVAHSNNNYSGIVSTTFNLASGYTTSGGGSVLVTTSSAIPNDAFNNYGSNYTIVQNISTYFRSITHSSSVLSTSLSQVMIFTVTTNYSDGTSTSNTYTGYFTSSAN